MEKIIIKCAPLAGKFIQHVIRTNVPWWPF